LKPRTDPSSKATASCVISVKATPNSTKDELQGWLGDHLKVRIQAPPTDGKANERLCAFLAEKLLLPKHSVNLSSGASSRQKRVSIQGLSLEEAKRRLT
jgi:uncharacterized protein (TIGR00251 family)